jgi:hypothetical protein
LACSSIALAAALDSPLPRRKSPGLTAMLCPFDAGVHTDLLRPHALALLGKHPGRCSGFATSKRKVSRLRCCGQNGRFSRFTRHCQCPDCRLPLRAKTNRIESA